MVDVYASVTSFSIAVKYLAANTNVAYLSVSS